MLLQNLYSVEFKDNTKAIIKLSDKNHPIFKAHFPDKPILPGFMNLEIVSDLFGIEIVNIKKAKFLDLIEPNQTLVYTRTNNSFKVFCKEKEVASFSL